MNLIQSLARQIMKCQELDEKPIDGWLYFDLEERQPIKAKVSLWQGIKIASAERLEHLAKLIRG